VGARFFCWNVETLRMLGVTSGKDLAVVDKKTKRLPIEGSD
jgi:hypothetical protein